MRTTARLLAVAALLTLTAMRRALSTPTNIQLGRSPNSDNTVGNRNHELQAHGHDPYAAAQTSAWAGRGLREVELRRAAISEPQKKVSYRGEASTEFHLHLGGFAARLRSRAVHRRQVRRRAQVPDHAVVPSPVLTPLTDVSEIDQLLADSTERPIMVLKHSRSCGTSAQAFDELQDHLNQAPEAARTTPWSPCRRIAACRRRWPAGSACATKRRRRSCCATAR